MCFTKNINGIRIKLIPIKENTQLLAYKTFSNYWNIKHFNSKDPRNKEGTSSDIFPLLEHGFQRSTLQQKFWLKELSTIWKQHIKSNSDHSINKCN